MLKISLNKFMLIFIAPFAVVPLHVPDKISEYDIYEVFRRYDVTRMGRLTIKDIPAAMLALGYNPTREELVQLIHTVNKDDRDYVDFPEFLTILALKVKDAEPEEELRQAFKVFDTDGNGNVSSTELRTTMFSLGETLSKADVNFMIKTADVNGDGQVDYEEFIRMMFTGLS